MVADVLGGDAAQPWILAGGCLTPGGAEGVDDRGRYRHGDLLRLALPTPASARVAALGAAGGGTLGAPVLVLQEPPGQCGVVTDQRPALDEVEQQRCDGGEAGGLAQVRVGVAVKVPGAGVLAGVDLLDDAGDGVGCGIPAVCRAGVGGGRTVTVDAHPPAVGGVQGGGEGHQAGGRGVDAGRGDGDLHERCVLRRRQGAVEGLGQGTAPAVGRATVIAVSGDVNGVGGVGGTVCRDVRAGVVILVSPGIRLAGRGQRLGTLAGLLGRRCGPAVDLAAPTAPGAGRGSGIRVCCSLCVGRGVARGVGRAGTGGSHGAIILSAAQPA